MKHCISAASMIFLVGILFHACPAQLASVTESKSAPCRVETASKDKPSPSQPETSLKLKPRPVIYDVEHKKICYSKDTCCFHPRHGAFGYFGNGEIVAGHNHAPCSYDNAAALGHDFDPGYQHRAVCLLQRSTDGGATWPVENNVVLFDHTTTEEQKKAFLYPKDAPRENYDMFSPDSMFYFGRTYLPKEKGDTLVCFSLRSRDRGRTWEKVPTIITHPAGQKYFVLKENGPIVRMPDRKTILASMHTKSGEEAGGIHGGVPLIYVSTDQGLTWNFYSQATPNPQEGTYFSYTNLLRLPTGEVQLYALHVVREENTVKGLRNSIFVADSMDGGKTWTPPRPIVCPEGQKAWGQSNIESKHSRFYRSPWPILLKDGRIVVVFGRRIGLMGIGGVVSADGGKTWSEEFVVRDDGGSTEELGYPVGAQMEDGRIIIIYYFTVDDGNNFGGTRHIAQSTFRLKE